MLKRPFMDHFMESVAQRFEVVVFTASLAKYADPLLDMLDKQACVRWRLFRGACFPYEGNYVKDLSCLGRDLSQVTAWGGGRRRGREGGRAQGGMRRRCPPPGLSVHWQFGAVRLWLAGAHLHKATTRAATCVL